MSYLSKGLFVLYKLSFLFVLENLRSESQDFNILELWKKKYIRCMNMELNNKIYFGIFWKLWKKFIIKNFDKKWAHVKQPIMFFGCQPSVPSSRPRGITDLIERRLILTRFTIVYKYISNTKYIYLKVCTYKWKYYRK